MSDTAALPPIIANCARCGAVDHTTAGHDAARPTTTAARCTRCGDDLSHYTTKVFRCPRYRMNHDPHHWVGKATDVLFYCDGIAPKEAVNA